jgi:hypothetical protein
MDGQKSMSIGGQISADGKWQNIPNGLDFTQLTDGRDFVLSAMTGQIMRFCLDAFHLRLIPLKTRQFKTKQCPRLNDSHANTRYTSG